MFKNYLKIALRNLYKHKRISIIGVGGLMIGISCAMIVALYVHSEINYDTFHKNYKNIYRIAWMSNNPQTRTPHPMALAMVKDFPEVVQGVSLTPIYGPGLSRPEFTVRYEDHFYQERGFYSADTTFFDVFSFAMIKGNPKTALQVPGGVVITKSIAQKYFGHDDPIGKMLYLQVGNELPMTVTGVIEDVPHRSHFHFDFLVSYVTLKPMNTGDFYKWADFGHFNYIVLNDKASAKQIEAKIPEWFLRYNDWTGDAKEALLQGRIGFKLQPITGIHLDSHLRWELEENSSWSTLTIFMVSAFFILMAACMNYMNLSTARLSNRGKEIGIRKVVGARRSDLFIQFLGESFIVSAVSVLLSCILVKEALPLLSQFHDFRPVISSLNPFAVFSGLVLLIVFISLIAGFYPAFVLSSSQSAAMLKGKDKSGFRNVAFRRFIVIGQFSISIALIAGMAIVFSQLDYLKNKKLGFNKDQVIVLSIQGSPISPQYESFKNELTRNLSVSSVSAVSNVPGSQFNQNPVRWEQADRTIDMSEIRVDYDFFKTLDISMVEGRAFSKEFSEDSGRNVILNEAAAKQFLWNSPINQEMIWYDDEITRKVKVVGVAKDFHFQSLHNTIEPLIFYVAPEEFNYLLIKIKPVDASKTLSFIQNKCKQFDPHFIFNYSFLDEDFRQLYQSEEQTQKILGYFTLLAILIASLGLYALITFSTQQRFKEIGIRKTLGCSVNGIVMLLSREFIHWVLISNVIAWPFAWIAMNKWLENFAYRIDLTIWPFLISGLLAVLIAMLTVSWQAFRAASANPIKSLKYE